MTFQKITIFWMSFLSLQLLYGQGVSELVYVEDGQLSYEPFAMTGQSDAVNTIPDFSHAGYMGGGVALPSGLDVRVVVGPEAEDDSPRIQAAIDMVASLPLGDDGFRGVVMLTGGHYSLESPLVIRQSGVVLRGEGQGLNGTVLHANPRVDHDVISILGSGAITIDGQSTQAITTAYVAVGSYSFEVADAADFAVGDKIVVTRTPNQRWIDELGMDQETLCQGKPGCNGWTASSYTIDHERVIAAITGNTLTLDIPIVDVMEDAYGGGRVSKVLSSRRISQCGVENMRIQSFYDRDVDEDHAWVAVRLRDSEHCWVKQVTGQYLAYSTVNIEDSNFTTVQDCAYIDPKSNVSGGRRYGFAVQKGLGNLFQRCYTKSGRHDFVTGSRVTGPNVFLDGLAEDARSDIGPHHRWATGSLFDNIRGGSIRVWNRGNSGSGHGWSGAQTMFWNIDSYGGEFRVDSPLGAINWGIGCTGSSQTGQGYWESWGNRVLPRSLYLQQLEDRLGSSAVDNVVIPEQRSGQIGDVLVRWGGQGDFARGGITGAAPVVSFNSPTSTIDVSTWQPTDIEVDASDSDGTISSVTLLINGEPIGTAQEAPYLFADVAAMIQNLPHTVHYLQAIAIDNDGNTGSSRVAIMGGDPPLDDTAPSDDAAVRVFPNPTLNRDLTIRVKEEGQYTVKVINLAGQIVSEFTFEGAEHQGIDPNLTCGMYVLQIEVAAKVLTRSKIVIK